MKKFLLSSFVTVMFGVYVFFQRSSQAAVSGLAPLPLAPAPATPTSAPLESLNSRPAPDVNTYTPPPVIVPPAVKSGLADGAYTGRPADAYYGTIQVKAIIQSGQIADVQFLQYPNNRRNSIAINSYAMPNLTSEAIQAQNANVDIISGATYSSLAFRESLGSALSQAKQ